HLAMELLKDRAGFQAEHIPYKGAAPAVQDLVGGHVPVMMLDTATAMPQLQAGSIKALAVASSERLPQLTDVPTLKELGYGDIDVQAWHGIVVPVSTPQAIRERLSDALQKAMMNEDLQKSLTDFGLSVTPGDAAQ